METPFTDVMRIFIRQYRIKISRNSGDPMLTDDEVCLCLQAMGLIRGDRDIIKERESIGLTESEAQDYARRVRYNLIQLWRSSSRIANIDILNDLLPKIDQLNNVGENEISPYREQAFREGPGLTQKDFRYGQPSFPCSSVQTGVRFGRMNRGEKIP